MEENNKSIILSDDKTTLSLGSNTSLVDFKSPKKEPIEKLKTFKYRSTKCKKKQIQLKIDLNNGTDKRARTSKQLQENISDDAHVSVESKITSEEENESKKSSNNVKLAFVCPLCFKNFKDDDSRTLHIKNCAAKRKVPIKKVLQAIKLQERQTAERVSLGLLAAPILQSKKPTSVSSMGMVEDSQLQLALALSKSLYEVEEKNCGETKNVGNLFLLKSPMENVTSRLQKKKKSNIVPVLKIRSQEERDRLLTEKIAEILLDGETLSQRQEQENYENGNIKRNNLRSRALKMILNFDNKLWNTAMLDSSQLDFYVTDLSPYIIPCERKSAFMESNDESNVTNKCGKEDSSAIKHDLCPNEKEVSNASHKTDVKLFADMRKESINQSPVNTLIVNWRDTLNNSSSSDVIIFVSGGKHIWVHKLVFYVRCSNILLDIVPNDNTLYAVKERICWIDVEYYVALAFLEFIYCGVIEKYAITSNNTAGISSLGRLARRYKVKELFPYLRHDKAHDKASKDYKFQTDEDIEEICSKNDEENKFTECNVLTPEKVDVESNNEDTFDINAMDIPDDQLLKANISPEIYTIPDSPVDRGNSVSPDIFDDTDNVTLNYTNRETPENNFYSDSSSPNQCDLETIITNELAMSLANKSESSTEEYVLNKSAMTSTKIHSDKAKEKGNLTLFIEKIQRENAKSDFTSDSEIDTPSKLIPVNPNRNPFRKETYDESSIVFDKLDFGVSPIKGKKKQSRLSKLESEMQIHASENPQLYNITVTNTDKNSSDSDHTDSSSSIKEINVSTACSNKSSDKQTYVSTARSLSSNSEMDTDDADISMYTKYKRKNVNNSIAAYRHSLKKPKHDVTEIGIDKEETDRANVSSLSDIDMDECFGITRIENNISSLSFSRKSRNEKDKLDRSDKSIISSRNNSFKNQSNESSDDAYFNNSHTRTPEFSLTQKQFNSPIKSPIDLNPILISSSPDIDVDKDDKRHTNLTTQDFNDQLEHFSWNETNFSNINTTNQIENATSIKSTSRVPEINRRLRNRSKSEGSLRLNYSLEDDYEISEFDSAPLRQCNTQDNSKSNTNNRLFVITESKDTSPPNYYIMNTPELHKEMNRYGLKVQNRKRAIKLLTYIYNELYPTINETLDDYDEDEKLQRKRKRANLSQNYNIEDLNDHSKRLESTKKTNVENLIAFNDCNSVSEAFFKLIKFNKDLHNQILRYEPLNIEFILGTLKAGGFKCKVNALIDFLDEQCITFFLPETKTKSKTKRAHN